jgi:hypothetical protein
VLGRRNGQPITSMVHGVRCLVQQHLLLLASALHGAWYLAHTMLSMVRWQLSCATQCDFYIANLIE